jgi:hypothetical protein
MPANSVPSVFAILTIPIPRSASPLATASTAAVPDGRDASHFTLDACRHGGMTELEEAALTEGQGRALSGHKTAQAYRGYAKETFHRALSATRKRHAHRLANIERTNGQNEGGGSGGQNEIDENKTTAAKLSNERKT